MSKNNTYIGYIHYLKQLKQSKMRSSGCFLLTILSLFTTLVGLIFLYLGGVVTNYYIVKANIINLETSINYISFKPTEYCIGSGDGLAMCYSKIDYLNEINFVDSPQSSNNMKTSIYDNIKIHFVNMTDIWIRYSLYVQILFFILFGLISLNIIIALLAFRNYKFISYACIITGVVFITVSVLAIVVLISFMKVSNYVDSSLIAPYIKLEYTNSIYGLCVILSLLLFSFIFLVMIRKNEYDRHESRELRRHQVVLQENKNKDYSNNVVIELDKNQSFTLDEENYQESNSQLTAHSQNNINQNNNSLNDNNNNHTTHNIPYINPDHTVNTLDSICDLGYVYLPADAEVISYPVQENDSTKVEIMNT